MNVQQLIKELQKYPPEMRVIVNGYEGGYDDTEAVESRQIRLNVNYQYYFGRHDDASCPLGNQDGSIETALLLS